MHARDVRADDLPEITELLRRWETAWFGAPESGADEVRFSYGLAEAWRALLDGERIVAAGWRGQSGASLVLDPDVDPAPLTADLLPWFAGHPDCELEALAQDTALQAALAEHGWRHTHSSFELIREVTPQWELAEPVWPDGICVRTLGVDEAPAVHRLIYDDAQWATVPGHRHRDYAEWCELFLTEDDGPDQHVLAWRGERLAGVAIGHTFSDNTGWVSQLAVGQAERGRGLGRALLLEALRRRRAAGAERLGLGVQQANRGALSLYLGVGLEIDREWIQYRHG